MAKRAQRRDAMDNIIESALQPGRFIGWNEGFSFVSELSHLEAEIAKTVSAGPARAVALYETFIAGCYLKAEEIDDSDGEFGTFAGGLFCGWIQARQAAGFDHGETAKLLLTRMDDDDYGFCNDLERSAVKVMNRAGLEAFEREVRARFDKEYAALSERKPPSVPNPNYARDRWGGVLRAIYAAQRNIGKYVDLTARTELTPADCETIATMFRARRKPAEALAWLERGIEIDKPDDFQRGASYKLAEMRRALLAKLGRGNEALDSAWTEFLAHPDKDSYHELLRYVPKAERAAWHEKAMAASEQGDLSSLIELWLGAKEIDRLVARLDRASNAQLEGLSHYATEPAAERLAKTHPGVAAKVFRALCVRIIDAGKSKYYHEALSNLEKAKDCYQSAGLEAQWQALAAEIRRDHQRKSSFMPGFERIIRDSGPSREPSFLDRARGRWAQKAKA
jgi:tetratricopeptide (TPR) repeat protein